MNYSTWGRLFLFLSRCLSVIKENLLFLFFLFFFLNFGKNDRLHGVVASNAAQLWNSVYKLPREEAGLSFPFSDDLQVKNPVSFAQDVSSGCSTSRSDVPQIRWGSCRMSRGEDFTRFFFFFVLAES